MRPATVTERVTIECAEEGRTAQLLVELSGAPDRRRVVAIQCDNPRLASLEPRDCHWSCWQQVESRLS